MNIQYETIIPCFYHVVGYKNALFGATVLEPPSKLGYNKFRRLHSSKNNVLSFKQKLLRNLLISKNL